MTACTKKVIAEDVKCNVMVLQNSVISEGRNACFLKKSHHGQLRGLISFTLPQVHVSIFSSAPHSGRNQCKIILEHFAAQATLHEMLATTYLVV